MEIVNIAFLIMGIAIVMILYDTLFNPGTSTSKILQKKMIGMGAIKGRPL